MFCSGVAENSSAPALTRLGEERKLSAEMGSNQRDENRLKNATGKTCALNIADIAPPEG